MRARAVIPMIGLMVLAAGGCGPPPALVQWVATENPDVLFYVDAADSVVGLTLDDGPHPVLTPAVLDVLAEHDAHATFFLVGEKIPENEALVRRIVAEGHELGNHMMTNTPSILFPPELFDEHLQQAHERLARLGPVRWFRPASGWFNDRMLQQARSLGYDTALGSVYPNDAQNPFPSYHVRYILRTTRPGSIIILHEGMGHRRRVVTVLRRVLTELNNRGYRVVTLSELAQHSSTSL